MEQNDKQTFWRFTIRYNVILLGGLYFALLAVMIAGVKGQMEGEMVYELMLVYFVLLFIALLSWIYCTRKSWKLTNFNSKLRIAIMAYLFGAPVFLFLISGRIVILILKSMGV